MVKQPIPKKLRLIKEEKFYAYKKLKTPTPASKPALKPNPSAPARPANNTPDPKSKLQIKTKAGSWMDVDSHSKDFSKVQYGNTTVVKPDKSKLRSVPVGGTRSKNK